MDTNLKVKKKYWNEFCKRIWIRIERGGDKYAVKGNPERESTDVAADIVPDFMLGDMIKYIGEYTNERKEKCLLDIAGFCFIKWLKDNHNKEKPSA